MDAKFEMQLAFESELGAGPCHFQTYRTFVPVDGDGNALGPPGGDWSEIEIYRTGNFQIFNAKMIETKPHYGHGHIIIFAPIKNFGQFQTGF